MDTELILNIASQMVGRSYFDEQGKMAPDAFGFNVPDYHLCSRLIPISSIDDSRVEDEALYYIAESLLKYRGQIEDSWGSDTYREIVRISFSKNPNFDPKSYQAKYKTVKDHEKEIKKKAVNATVKGKLIGSFVELSFKYNLTVLDIVRSIFGRRWNPNNKTWSIPKDMLGNLVHKLNKSEISHNLYLIGIPAEEVEIVAEIPEIKPIEVKINFKNGIFSIILGDYDAAFVDSVKTKIFYSERKFDSFTKGWDIKSKPSNVSLVIVLLRSLPAKFDAKEAIKILEVFLEETKIAAEKRAKEAAEAIENEKRAKEEQERVLLSAINEKRKYISAKYA